MINKSSELTGSGHCSFSCARPTLTLPFQDQMIRSIGYALAVAYSYTLMLLFMTYNAYV